MTDDLPPPPVPADLDLSTLDYMPLRTGRLLASDTWLLATGDEAKAAVTLWCRAWHQVPAGSLPDNDRLLAQLSGAGNKWPKVRDVALRGFTKHSDGRLYHEFICHEALDANEKRIKWREKKRRQRGGQDGGSPRPVPGDSAGTSPNGPSLNLRESNSPHTPLRGDRGTSGGQDRTRRRGTTGDLKPAGSVLDAVTERWRARLVSFAKSGAWLPGYGPKPHEPGCEAPAALVAEICPPRDTLPPAAPAPAYDRDAELGATLEGMARIRGRA